MRAVEPAPVGVPPSPTRQFKQEKERSRKRHMPWNMLNPPFLETVGRLVPVRVAQALRGSQAGLLDASEDAVGRCGETVRAVGQVVQLDKTIHACFLGVLY